MQCTLSTAIKVKNEKLHHDDLEIILGSIKFIIQSDGVPPSKLHHRA